MTKFNDNVVVSADGGMACVHCTTVLAAPGEPHLQRALIRVGDISLAGPHVQASEPRFVDEPVEFRQLLCPGCGTALQTEVAAQRDVLTRTASLSRAG